MYWFNTRDGVCVKFKLVLFILFLILVTGCASADVNITVGYPGNTGNYTTDGINDEVQISQAINAAISAGGGTVYLKGPNTYWIANPIDIYGSNLIITGDSTAELKLNSSLTWEAGVPLFNIHSTYENVSVIGFTIDGNRDQQSHGQGTNYHTFISSWRAENITVSNMRLEYGLGDGLRVEQCNNITFSNNDVYKLGHEGMYALNTNNTQSYGNTILVWADAGIRLMGSSHGKIYNNTIYSEIDADSTGPLIKLDEYYEYNGIKDVEIYNNKLYTSNGAGILIDCIYENDTLYVEDIYIHHNTIANTGQYSYNTGYTDSGIVIGNANNTTIENNVIDSCGKSGIKWGSVDFVYIDEAPVPIDTTQARNFTTIVRNNVITGSISEEGFLHSGAGIWNTNTTYAHFIVENNDIYNNTLGQFYPASGDWLSESNNLNASPLFVNTTATYSNRDYHLKSTAGRWNGTDWVNDTVNSPLIDAGYVLSPYTNEPEPNGDRINIGVYGNTIYASKSLLTITELTPWSRMGDNLESDIHSTFKLAGTLLIVILGIAILTILIGLVTNTIRIDQAIIAVLIVMVCSIFLVIAVVLLSEMYTFLG